MSEYIMDRESLKRHCEAMCHKFKDVPTSGTYGEHRLILELLEQTTWIPVSERLPKDRKEVLVTAYWHETYQVMMASYFGDGLWWCVPFNNCGEHMQKLNPIAWMPLPQHFEAESEPQKGANE